MSAPAHTALSVQQFLTKKGKTPCPTLPIHQILTQVTFFSFVFSDEKCPQRKRFVDVEEMKQKIAELKGIKIAEFEKCFEQ